MVVCVLFNFQRISRGGRSCTAGRYRHSSPSVVIIIHFVCLSEDSGGGGGRSCTAGRYRHSSPSVVIIIHSACLSV